MSIGSVSNVALAGIRRGMERAQHSAMKIAATSPGGSEKPIGLDQTVRAMVELKEVSHQVKISATTLKVGNDALGTLLDVLA